LSKSLTQAKTLLSQGERNVETIRRAVTQTILDGTEFIIDYVSITHSLTLQELTNEELTALETSPTPHAAVLLAAKLGTTRLIDNALIPLRAVV
jgi:pantothenate synthetase